MEVTSANIFRSIGNGDKQARDGEHKEHDLARRPVTRSNEAKIFGVGEGVPGITLKYK